MRKEHLNIYILLCTTTIDHYKRASIQSEINNINI